MPASTAASANVQRAPTLPVIGPASAIPSPSSAKLTLMMVVNARPRRWSGAPRWTISELHTMAVALPAPPTAMHAAPSHTLGDSAAPSAPKPIRPIPAP